MRSNDLVGRAAVDRAGKPLGRVVDLVTEVDAAGVPEVVAVVVTTGWHGRLLGYERDAAGGPWLLDRVARLLFGHTDTVAWNEVQLLDRR
jgi:hypothetical protein